MGRLKMRIEKGQDFYVFGELAKHDISATFPGAIPLLRVTDPADDADSMINLDCDLVESYMMQFYGHNHSFLLAYPSPAAIQYPRAMSKIALAYTNLALEAKGQVPPTDADFRSQVPIDAPPWNVPGVKAGFAPIGVSQSMQPIQNLPICSVQHLPQ